MKLKISIAERRADVLRCQYFIAEIYNKNYQIMFSEDGHDLEARIEPYPQRYLMGTVDGQLVTALGLYTRNTYVERYGGITDEEIQAQLESAGVAEQYKNATRREMTKLVVREGWESLGLARIIHKAGHARSFLDAQPEGEARPVLVLICARLSIFKHFFQPRGTVKSRFLAPFPRYPIHNEYRSDADTMESRLIIPDVDCPPGWRDQVLPMEVELDEVQARAGGIR